MARIDAMAGPFADKHFWCHGREFLEYGTNFFGGYEFVVFGDGEPFLGCAGRMLAEYEA
jgi:hypothetical protein